MQNQAQQVGITSIVTKPIDPAELESRMSKAMNLDTSSRYYKINAGFLVMSLPEVCTPLVQAELSQYPQPKLSEAVDAGLNKVVIDLHPVRSLHMNTFKFLVEAMQACRGLAMNFALIGNPLIISECKGLEETRSWNFHETLESAKAHLTKNQAAPLVEQAVLA